MDCQVELYSSYNPIVISPGPTDSREPENFENRSLTVFLTTPDTDLRCKIVTEEKLGLKKSHNLHFNPTQETVLDLNSDAHQLFDEMPERDVKSATALIGHFAKHNQHREAIVCFLRMLRLDIRPNDYTFCTLVHSSVILKDLHLGKQIHSHAKKVGLSSNVFVGSSILNLYVKLSNIDDALRAFQDINEPNVVSHATLIRGYMKEGRFDEAGVVFRSMPEKNVVSWNTMISGCSQSGKMRKL
ncbi:hypothetical protein DH2020_025916 [Rehmannia glutinosa]|uniref:Pentatricopeptide repeat-containing protein n=1 Tax=Rehmannia glutinosa TaxID=99300 RepID=A0ABR0W291_REHGL